MILWNGFRVMPNNKEYLSLEEVVKLAEKIGGNRVPTPSTNDSNYSIIHLPRSFTNRRVWVMTQECYDDLRQKRNKT